MYFDRRLTSESITGVTTRSYLYDKQSNIAQIQDFITNAVTKFQYDMIGRTIGIKSSDGQRLDFAYDSYNRLLLSKWSKANMSLSTGYVYGDTSVSGQKTGLIYGITLNNIRKLSYQYDNLTRLTTRTLNTTTPYVTEYGYLEGATAKTTTTMIKTVKNGNDTLEYAYDEVGNIISVKKNGTIIEQYTYDSLNQLASATYGGDTYTYTYDNGGNITEIKKNGTTIKSYTYGNTEWKDLLTAFNGESITYDEIGNPLTYRNGMSFTWQNGRQLASITQNGIAIVAYTYNTDGLRTSKTVNGVTTEYYWLNGTLYGQKTGDEYLYFLYDENGTVYGFILKTNTSESYYYYEFNLQGDIIGIIDSAGNKVVEYTYGAWGDILSITGILADTIGQKNPLRYRGYYYDAETGFYYLNNRYYDPEIGRWVNADNVISGTGESVQGYNLYSYCFNNPVNMSDPSGNWPKWAKEIVNRVKYAVTMTFRVFTSPLKAVDAKVGLGVGIGGEVSGKVKGITVSGAAKTSYTDSLQLEKGKFDVKSSNTQEIGFSVGKLSVGKSSGQEHSFFDKKCTCDLINTPIIDQAECYANKEFVEENYTIGLSASLYIGIGGEASLGININDFFNELIDIYHTEYVGYY